MQAAFVEFVEQHRRHAFERRITLQHAREYTFGDDFDACAPADASLLPHSITDCFTR
jgi:hypothetical protein